ncbi:MAG: adenylyltransferase/cytidyltransferase family protein [Rhodobacteraceae bacterium]|nr:adenylyltransferase/cytidyltransferase family protein [Paracoccaceae bacterium]
MKVSIVSGGFDPLHVGHVELFERARELSDELWVILNTDDFLTNKKGKPFMPFDERRKILKSLRVVDVVIPCIDKDQTVCKTLKKLKKTVPRTEKLFFCNGGDRTNGENTPEHKLCEEVGIETIYGLGDKIQSSSWLTK